jgi:4-cresol dehydrogenase (hydroxylating)
VNDNVHHSDDLMPSMSPLLQAAMDAWRGVLGEDRVLAGAQMPAKYLRDTSNLRREVPVVLKAQRAEQVPSLLRIASEHRIAIHPISTGNNWGYGGALAATDGAAILDLSDLNGILHFDAELGVVTVEPGVTQGMLADFLDRQGLGHLVPVTGAGPNCSILANALERGYGITPYVDHFSAVTDLEAVLADGSIYQTALREAGGEDLARLFRWGIGPYINGLFSQSGFGVVTRASILLAQRPECVKVCLFNLSDDGLLESAVERIRMLLKTLPGTLGGINLMNRHRVLAMTCPYPSAHQLDDHGLMSADTVAELGRQYQIAPWTGFATLYGSKRMVAAAQKEIRQTLKGVASRLLFLSPTHGKLLAAAARRVPGKIGERLGKTSATLNAAIQLVQGRPNETALPLAYWRSQTPQPLSGRNPSTDGCGLLWYAPLVPMRATDVRRFVQFASHELRERRLEPLITLTSQGDRLFDSTVPLLFNRQDPEAAASAQVALEHLVQAGRELGFYPYRLHVLSMPPHFSRQPLSASITDRLKRSLDPDDILAPGRYCPQFANNTDTTRP